MRKIHYKILKWLKVDIVLSIIVLAYYVLLYLLGTTCLVKYFFNIDCPTCGMTRAIICFVKFDFKGYLAYNFLALPTAILIYFRLHIDKGKLYRVLNTLLIIDSLFILVKYIFL